MHGTQTEPLFYVVEQNNPNYRQVRPWGGSSVRIEYMDARTGRQAHGTEGWTITRDMLLNMLVEWSEQGDRLTYSRPRSERLFVDPSLT